MPMGAYASFGFRMPNATISSAPMSGKTQVSSFMRVVVPSSPMTGILMSCRLVTIRPRMTPKKTR